jgi:hypothetical protein
MHPQRDTAQDPPVDVALGLTRRVGAWPGRTHDFGIRLPPNVHQEAAQMNKVFWLAAIFAIAMLTGCSSPSLPTSTNIPAGHLTGTMSDWTSAICERGSGPLPMAHGRMLGGAPNPMVCQGLMQTGSGTRMPVPISIGTYTSESLMAIDLSRVGAYAKGNDGTEYVVLAALSTLGPSLSAESAMLQPLRAYGFEVIPSPNPSVEPAPTQPIPGSTNAMPPQTPTAEPPAATTTAQPYWDGPLLRNYSEGDQDCDRGGLDYWVVQPGGDTGMYALKKGCFPQNWMNILNTHCQSYDLPKGQCAVWDQDSIMSTFGRHGDLLIVALTQACLDRAGLTDFHEGPIHQDCVVHP